MWELKNLVKFANSNLTETSDHRWIPVRPINWKYRSFFEKLKEAYNVFIGKYDTFQWPK